MSDQRRAKSIPPLEGGRWRTDDGVRSRCQMPDARCRWPVAGEPGALVLTGHRHPSEAGILEERHTAGVSETALLSEVALAEDWDRPEEDEAWRRLRAGA